VQALSLGERGKGQAADTAADDHQIINCIALGRHGFVAPLYCFKYSNFVGAGKRSKSSMRGFFAICMI
jgi:hypothetical protein